MPPPREIHLFNLHSKVKRGIGPLMANDIIPWTPPPPPDFFGLTTLLKAETGHAADVGRSSEDAYPLFLSCKYYTKARKKI